MRRAAMKALGLALGSALPMLALGCAARSAERGDVLVIGAYTVMREVLHDGILPEFAAEWRRHTGRTISFEESYNASGAQARAIAAGFDADIVILALEPDMDLLVRAGLVDRAWNQGPERGIVSRSMMVIGHRPGNPQGIHDWSDLARPGMGVLYPDPKISGAARWNINAIYGAALLQPGARSNRAAARRLLGAIQANVAIMDATVRQSMATFERGTGDAIVTYEHELLLRRKVRGAPAPYVIPSATLWVESPAAIVRSSVERHGTRAAAAALLAFIRSDAGQQILVDYGFRPLDRHIPEPTDRPPLPPGLFTMADLGGWQAINRELYAPGGVWDQLFTGREPNRGGPRQ